MVHHILSIVAPLGRAADVPSGRLTPAFDYGADSADVRSLRASLERLPMVHFASIQSFSGDTPESEQSFQPCLVLESCIDGSAADYLDALVAKSHGMLARVFAACSDFQIDRPDAVQYLRGYLQAHLLQPQLYHIGNPDLRVDHITSGRRLRDRLEVQLDTLVARGRSLDPPREIVEELRLETNAPPSSRLHWHLDLEELQPVPAGWYADPVTLLGSRLANWSRLLLVIAVPLAGLAWVWLSFGWWALIAAIAGAAAIWWLFLRWLRGRNREPATVDRDAIRTLKELEDFGVQNHMASLILLKDGLARRISIRIVLHGLNLIYRTLYTDITPGRLNGLPTIHFAHWSIVPVTDRRGRRREGLLFLSHYDGSWETYLDDFLGHVFGGVVAIWANAAGFPWPLDGPTFKRWARGCMSPWQFWYQGYPDLTVLNIANNDAIRTGLLRQPTTDAEARLWLARFGSIKAANEVIEPPLGALQTPDIQGLVLSGYRHLPHAAYIVLRVERDAAARAWLADLVPRITDARHRSKGELKQQRLAFNVAFTFSGLQALGLVGSTLAAFSESFQEGVAPGSASHRSRALGDVDGNDPKQWAWGSGDKPADILLMIFAFAADNLAAEVRAQVDAFTSCGAGTLVAEPLSGNYPSDQDGKLPRFAAEHFGFADGISQPQIEGTQRPGGRRLEEPADIQKPGEFLLGYPANDGTLTPGIPLTADLDLEHLLPGVPDAQDLRDFGRNGSYLVFRQLAQDVAAFRRATAKAAGAGDWTTGSGAAEQAAARMVGRWRDGSLLMPQTAVDSHGFPASAGAAAHQSGFGHDPHGFGCPIGSHIRRANPRDSLLPDASAALDSANRHRLLRRGRPYGPALQETIAEDDGQERGMAFICLNSDIERQFEFVQQNWVNNPAFGGLYQERDPLVGTVACDGGRLTVQANGVRQRLNGFSQFVTVKGGGYFFLPGIRALRYLSSLDGTLRLPDGQLAPRAPIPTPPPQSPSLLRRTLTRVEGILLSIRAVWGARFPLLLGVALIALAWVPAWLPATATSRFAMDRFGVAIVALLASLAASVVMITLRLVLLYGWRSTGGRARWTTPARWWQVLAFEALAFPVIAAVIHYSARSLTAGGVGSGGYRGAVMALLPPAALGILAAWAVVALTTALQALRPESGAGLFFPPTSPLARVSASGWRPAFLWRISSRLSQLSQWIVDGVPEGIGRGYIDYRRRRILPGHAFAALMALATAALCAFAAIALSPAPCAPEEWLPRTLAAPLCELSGRVPALAGLLARLIAAGWLLAGLSFFLDRYRVSTVLLLGIGLLLIASVTGTDPGLLVGQIVSLVRQSLGQ